MFTIKIAEKGGKPRIVDISQDEASIGRVQGNDVVLPLGNVSKKHCIISYRNGTFWVRDSGSTNGTYINGRKINEPTSVSETDKIYVGEFIVGVSLPAADMPEAAPAKPPIPPPTPKARKSCPPPAPKADRVAGDAENRNRIGRSASLDNPPTAGSETAGVFRAPNGTDDGYFEQLLDFVAIEVDGVNRTDLPCSVDDTTAAHVRMVLQGMLRELESDGHLKSDKDSRHMLMDAFLELVDLGPLTGWLKDPAVSEIQICGHDTINLRSGSGFGIAKETFSDDASLETALRCLGAGRPGVNWNSHTGNARFRLDTGELVVAQISSVTGTPAAHIYKHLAGEFKDTKTAKMPEGVVKPIARAISTQARIAVTGNSPVSRLAIMDRILRMLPPDQLVATVESDPLLLCEGDNRLRLSIPAAHKTPQTLSFSALLDSARQLNPEWLAVGGINWPQVPKILATCAERGGILCELPIGKRGSLSENMTTGLSAAGMGLSLRQGALFLATAFDLIVVAETQNDGVPHPTQVIRPIIKESTPVFEELYHQES